MATAGPREPALSLANLLLVALVAVAIGLGAAYAIGALARTPRVPPPSLADRANLISVSVSGVPLSVPTAWLREKANAPSNGFLPRLDLAIVVPLPNGGEAPVEITLLPRPKAPPSSVLLNGVYMREFSDKQLDGPPGLVGKPLEAAPGLAGETVWYDPLSPDPFVAKCLATAPEHPARCLRTVYLASGLAAVYAFDDTLLQDWRQLDAELSRWLERIGAN